MKLIALVFSILFIPNIIFCQSINISGYVKDAQTGEALIGANIFSGKNKTGTSTNEYGFFSFQSEKGGDFYRNLIRWLPTH